MPRCCSSAPRKKLPPPTTMATCDALAAPPRRSARAMPLDDVGVDAERAAAEHLTGELEQHPVVAHVAGGGPSDSSDRRLRSRPASRTPSATRCLARSVLQSPATSSDGRPVRRGRLVAGACTRAAPQAPVGRAPGGQPRTRTDEAGRRRRRPRVEHLRDGLLVVLGERLLEQDVLLEEAVDATLDDLRQGRLGLALLAGGLLGDATLVLDRLGRRPRRGSGRSGERGDVHRDVAARRPRRHRSVATSTPTCGGQVRAGLVQVDATTLALEAGHAADLDLLADGGVGLVEQRRTVLPSVERRGQQRLGVGRRRWRRPGRGPGRPARRSARSSRRSRSRS